MRRRPAVSLCKPVESFSQLCRIEHLEVDIEQAEMERELVRSVRTDLDDAAVGPVRRY